VTDGQFVRQLRGLARASHRDLNPEAYELYDVLVLEPHGDDASSAALLQWVRQNQRSLFPTPGELLAILQPEASPKSQASELAARVLAAIARRGWTWSQSFHYDGHATFRDALVSELGEPVAAFVERLGGWGEVCRQFGGNDAPAALRAQLRDSLESVVVQHASAKLLGASKPKVIESRRGELTHIGEIAKAAAR
jgi:hypothetical protein